MDYGEAPKTPREYLVLRLIGFAEGAPVPYLAHLVKRLRCDCITTLGRAKATAALETINELLFDHDEAIQGAAASALVSFGNLALYGLARSLNRLKTLLGPILSSASLEVELELHAGRRLSGAHKYHARTVNTYIDVLRRINTGGSAKLLLGLYEFSQRGVRVSTSLALARMLNNPFIEADLQQLRRESLPEAVRQSDGADDNVWPYKNLPPGSGFPQLASHIVSDLSSHALWISPTLPAPLADPDEVPAIPLKIMFPALLKYIKSKGTTGHVQELELPDKFWTDLGFGERADTARLKLLATQIRNSYSTTLSAALQSAGVVEADSGDAPGRRWVSITVWLSNIYFTLYVALFICFSSFFVWYAYNRTAPLPPSDRVYVAPSVGVSLLIYFSVIVITQLRLRRRLLSAATLDTLLFPVSNLLKVFRHSVTSKRWLKFICLMSLLQFLNPLFLACLMGTVSKKLPGAAALLMTAAVINAGLIAFAAAYLKFYLLAGNPTLQLLLAHPEGARLAKSS